MEDLGFGEDKELIDYIIKNISAENKKGLTAETVANVLDFMLDYYDEKGFLDEESDNDEVEIDETDMAAYILMHLQKEHVKITEDQLYEILDLEYEYDKKNGLFV